MATHVEGSRPREPRSDRIYGQARALNMLGHTPILEYVTETWVMVKRFGV